MKTNNKIFRDKFSGHWIIQYKDYLLDCYRNNRYDWDIHPERTPDVYFTKLDVKGFIINWCYKGHVIPSFASLRAGLKWFETIDNGGKFEEWP